MSADLQKLLSQLSRDDLQHLLAAKEELEALQQRRDELRRELEEVEARLAGVLGATVRGRAKTAARTGKVVAKKRKKATRQRAAKKGAASAAASPAESTGGARAKKAKKKITKKSAKKSAKKSTKKSAKKSTKKVAKKASRNVAAKPARRRTAATTAGAEPRVKLEDVVVGVLEQHGSPMPFQELLATIVEGQLVASRSANFANVLRRTISMSERIKWVARGVYGL